MLINVQCRQCQQIFDSDVGQVSFKLEADRPEFEQPIVCPQCGERTMDQVWLTEIGQGQLTEAMLNS